MPHTVSGKERELLGSLTRTSNWQIQIIQLKPLTLLKKITGFYAFALLETVILSQTL